MLGFGVACGDIIVSIFHKINGKNDIASKRRRFNMFHTIGEAAGEIWRILQDEESLSLSAVVRRVKKPQAVAYMGIGWLAREEKLVFTETNRGMAVSLKK